MNPKEEELAHWWGEFLVSTRKYDILMRNLYVAGKGTQINEFDAVGIKFLNGRRTENILLEDIEYKYATPGKELRAERELGEQLERIKKFSGFDSLIGASNSELAVRRLPEYYGAVKVGGKNEAHPSGFHLRAPSRLDPKTKHRENILKVVRQVFGTAEIIGMPCIFIKCKNRHCPTYYGFLAREPLPVSFDETGTDEHSEYCPYSERKSSRYEFLKVGFTHNGRTYFTTRKNSLT